MERGHLAFFISFRPWRSLFHLKVQTQRGDATCPHVPCRASIQVRVSPTPSPSLCPPRALDDSRELALSSGDFRRPFVALGFWEIYLFLCRRQVLTSSHESEGLSRTVLCPSPSASSLHLSPPSPCLKAGKSNLKIIAKAYSVLPGPHSKLPCLASILRGTCNGRSYLADETSPRVKRLVEGRTAGRWWSQNVNLGSVTGKGLRVGLLWSSSLANATSFRFFSGRPLSVCLLVSAPAVLSPYYAIRLA